MYNRCGRVCISHSLRVDVRLNMLYSNDGQRRFPAERKVTAGSAPALAPSPKHHNAKRCPLVIRERIVNALAAGDCKSSIARALRVSRNTIFAVAEQEWLKVEQRKARIAAQAERAATRAFERINNKLDSPDDIPLNVLVPVAGMSVDKVVALRGDPGFAARIERVESINIFQMLQ